MSNVEATNVSASLNQVYFIKATTEQGVYVVNCNIMDMYGDTQDCEYVSRPDDSFGLNPTMRQWLADNPDFPVAPYSPPTAQERRARLPPLTARQFRLGLVNAGISLSTVTAAIKALPTGPDRDKAEIEWEYATTFSRAHPLIATVSTLLALNDEQVDAMWTAAIQL